MTDYPSQPELEALFVNNADLGRVTGYLNRFNPIRVMRMESMEVRHSNILAWLMDPMETHGFGDRFLRAFLSEACRGADGASPPTALEIAQADLHDIEIRREWHGIDIFIRAPRQGWAFVIENKYYSSQHGNQLARYREKVVAVFEARQAPVTVRGIFLTLSDEVPEDSSYLSIGYQQLAELLSTIIERQGQAIGTEVRGFLAHYLEIINEATGMSHERNAMQKLARELYRTHRRALDFILEHGTTTDFGIALSNIFGEDWEEKDVINDNTHDYRSVWYNGSWLSFMPKEWFDAFGGDLAQWPGCEKYGAGHPVYCWTEIRPDADGSGGTLSLQAEVGPLADYDKRKELIADIQRSAGADSTVSGRVGFRKGAATEGTKYSRFIKQKKTKLSDVQDSEEIQRELRKLFLENRVVFDRLTPVFKKFGKKYGGRHE
ncbi:PD-(D/E)XK nuclease family protein [Paracoccus sphaerophysae]|uniref:PDDEXK-like family protein n=1 Tax=Paracoccus sphaerophysae TaxID=690417 RepID=UPI0023569356|nr:PD-(D/E)XK nuclease family protein [Paracoccus sphaerophysae]